MIGGVAEFADLAFASPGSWWPKSLQGTPTIDEALADLGFVERFEVAILRGEAARARDVHHEHGLAGVILELDLAGLVELGEGNVVGGGHGLGGRFWPERRGM